MTPDIEELIKKVNTLTLDKNRLKQKLNQLNQSGNSTSPKEISGVSFSQSASHLSSLQSSTNNNNDNLRSNQNNEGCDFSSTNRSGDRSANNKETSSANDKTNLVNKNNNSIAASIIAGVECSTSCEEDLLYMNELYRKRLEDYSDNWDFVQSKCTALSSELNALQKQYAFLMKEKLDLEDKYKTSCDECDKIRSELQTVVLNYEAQLSAMSDHLTMITNQVSLNDANPSKVQQHR